MDFEFDDDHKMLQQSVRDFATKEVAVGAAERDRNAEMPESLLKQLGELGLFGIAIPEQYGGAGMGSVASSLVVEEISKACGGTGVLLSAHGSLCVDPIMIFGLLFTLASGGDLLILWLIRKVKPGEFVQDHPTRAGCYVIEDADSALETPPAA